MGVVLAGAALAVAVVGVVRASRARDCCDGVGDLVDRVRGNVRVLQGLDRLGGHGHDDAGDGADAVVPEPGFPGRRTQ